MRSKDVFWYFIICLTLLIVLYSKMLPYSVDVGHSQMSFIQQMFTSKNNITFIPEMVRSSDVPKQAFYLITSYKKGYKQKHSKATSKQRSLSSTNSNTHVSRDSHRHIKTSLSPLSSHRNVSHDSTRQAQTTSRSTGCVSWDNLYSNNSQAKLVNTSDLPDLKLFQQNRNVEEVNCRLLFSGDVSEQARAAEKMQNYDYQISSIFNINETQNCENYFKATGYITSPLTSEEAEFPIAYSLMVFKDIRQVELLLRSIYRPQNLYCIHCDIKASADFKNSLKAIVQCFPNVFMSSESFDVSWGTINVLLPELTCMKGLLKYKKWKYFINLTGQEFPLRTNYELVKILKTYNGSNNLESTVKRKNKDRFDGRSTPPHNIRPLKGSVHIVANRNFVDFIVNDRVAADFLNWTKQVNVPDETYFASLNSNPHLNIPGSYKGEPETDCDAYPFLTRFKNWGNSAFDWPCYGKRVRLICIFGTKDLPLLASRQELFANKFHWDYHPYTYRCMDELIFNRTRDEYFKLLDFNVEKYKSLPFLQKTLKS